ncbi:MAG TPA: toll/interleukin-1 receptor domain-containing protein [Pyrinomonadaceae bacterium]|jgi:hypothetical protein
MSHRTKVFISYSHEDEDWLNRLRVHLRPLEREYDVEIWDDRKIRAGSKWREEIEDAISSAKVAVLLISASFLASDFIATDELPPLLEAAKKEGATVLPVIISPSRFSRTNSLCQFQAINSPSAPLIDLPRGEQEAILEKVAEAIETSLRLSPQPHIFLSEKDGLTDNVPPMSAGDNSNVKKDSRVEPTHFYKQRRYALIIGAVIILSLLAWLIYVNKSKSNKVDSKTILSEPTLRSYFAYITLDPIASPEGAPTPAAYPIPKVPPNCHVTYHVALRFEVPEGQQAVYVDRIKSGGGGTGLDSNPSHEVRNPNQWPGNSTLLEFKIEEKQQPSRFLDIEAVAFLDTVVTRERAKVGPHLPYRTEYVVVVVDYSRMKFSSPPSDIWGQIEFLGPGGVSQTETLAVVSHPEVRDGTVTVVGRNLPAKSHILIRWGPKQ